MRFLIALFSVCVAAFAPLAWAQKDAPAPAAANLAPSHIAAARDTLHAMMIETGALEEGSRLAFTLQAPLLRQQITSTPWFAGLTPQHQRDLNAYFERLGAVGQEETMRGAPDVIDAFAPRFAAFFTEAELADIANHMRNPAGGSAFHRELVSAIRSESSGQATLTDYTPEELAERVRFEQTPGGAVYNRRDPEFSRLMNEIGRAFTGSPRVSARIQGDMCAIVGAECPPGWRG